MKELGNGFNGTLSKAIESSKLASGKPKWLQDYMLAGDFKIGTIKDEANANLQNFAAQLATLDKSAQRVMFKVTDLNENVATTTKRLLEATAAGKQMNSVLFEQTATSYQAKDKDVAKLMDVGFMKKGGKYALPDFDAAVQQINGWAAANKDADRVQRLLSAGVLELGQNGLPQLSAAFMKDVAARNKEIAATKEQITNQVFLNDVLQMGKQILASLAISALIWGVQAVYKHFTEIDEKIAEIASDSKEQAESLTKARTSLADIVKRYEEIGNKTTHTAEDTAELKSLQEELTETLKDQPGIDEDMLKQVNLQNASYETQLQLLKDIEKQQRENARPDLENNVEDQGNLLVDAYKKKGEGVIIGANPYPSYSFEFSYKYKVSEGESVNRYEFWLYDANRELLKKSVSYYYRDSLKGFQIDGLDNHTLYYLRATAESVGGYQLDTGLQAFRTDYPEYVDDVKFTVQNNYRMANISMHAQYFLTRSSGTNALRIKRRKKGAAIWTSLYQEEIDLNHVIMKMGWSNLHINKTTGQPIGNYKAVTSDYIDKNRVLSFQFKSEDKAFCLIAYTADRKFIKASSDFTSTDEFRSSSEYKEWFSETFLNNMKYYRVEVSATKNQDLEPKDFNDFYMYSADDGYVMIDYTDLYAIGRKTDYEYAVAPVANGIELGYAKASVVSDFDGAVITDGNKTYHIFLEPKVDSVEKVRSATVVETMGSKYPYLFAGSEANYYSGHFSGVGIRFDNIMKDFDINGGNTFRDELSEWLTNGSAKLLKMFDGRR